MRILRVDRPILHFSIVMTRMHDGSRTHKMRKRENGKSDNVSN